METLRKVGRFLRFVDEQGQLSLTNVSLLVVIVRTALLPALSFADIATLAAALASYQSKRWLTKDQTPADTLADLQNQIKELETKIAATQLAAGIRSKF